MKSQFRVELDDFTMVGKTVARRDSQNRITVCSVGLSRGLEEETGWGLLRVYPLSKNNCPKDWSVCQIPLERNPKDSRKESWKLAGDRSAENHDAINSAITLTSETNSHGMRDLIEEHTVSSIAEANRMKISLCFIRPTWTEIDHTPHKESPSYDQISLIPEAEREFDPYGPDALPYTPVMRFGDKNGIHRLQYRDWGTCELLRKGGPSTRHKVFGANRLDEPGQVLLCGSMNGRRNVWLVIKAFRLDEQLSLIGPNQRKQISDRDRSVVIGLAGGMCLACGSGESLEVDHVVPIISGGSSELSNLQALCAKCNRNKWTRTIDYRELAA